MTTTVEADASLRDSLEAAIETVEKPDAPETPTTPLANSTTAKVVESQEGSGSSATTPNATVLGKKEDAPQTTPIGQVTDPLPKSWKPTLGDKWKGLDPDIKAEVIRRERDVTKAFGENSQVREFHRQFGDVVRPFEARIRSVGLTPLQAANELFKADHILSTAPATQRARYMADLIKQYGVDIKELDSALAGEAAPDPVASRLEELIQQKLSPIENFMNQQRQAAQYREMEIQQEAGSTIEQMASDPTKFPHFDSVRMDMADIIEMGAKRGLYFSPEQAYTRAVAMNPEWNAQMVSQRQAEAQLSQAQATNARAQKALGAAASISGAPGGSPGGVNPNGSLRDTIEAAWSQVNGR